MPTPRPLALDEMDDAARVHRAAFDAQLPWLAGLHTTEEDRDFWRGHVFPACSVWGVVDGDLAGVIAFRDEWVEQLYVRPGRQRQGIGSALLAVAQRHHPVLELWTFQRNTAARAFYERHGFRAVRETDGDNEEREPDVLYRWERAAEPLVVIPDGA